MSDQCDEACCECTSAEDCEGKCEDCKRRTS